MKKIFLFFGLNPSIIFTVSGRLIQAIGGLILIFLVSKFLTKEEQGYYYTFGSLIAIQIFFELGFTTIITQFVAHENAHINWDEFSLSEKSQIHVSRLSFLFKFCLKLFTFLSIVLLFTLIFLGIFFFKKFSSSNVIWEAPWVILAFSTSLLLVTSPILSFFEGLGKVKEVALIRLFQQLFSLIIVIISFLCGQKLYSLAFANFSSFLVIIFSFSLSYFRKNIHFFYTKICMYKIDYFKEIFPFQWKIALSWISGYFIFQLFNPVLFATEGPVVAGKMGITLAIFNGISTISMSWITTKISIFSNLIALNKRNELDLKFRTTIKQIILVNLTLLLIFYLFIYILNKFNFELAFRFLEIKFLIILGLVTLSNQIIFSLAFYLRCHKNEPFLINSIVGSFLTAFSTVYFGNKFGLNGIIYGYAFLTIMVGLPWAFITFIKKRSEWS